MNPEVKKRLNREEPPKDIEIEPSENRDVKDLWSPCLEIIYKLREQIEGAEYGSVVGDDASGRIPTLIIGNAISKIYERNGDKSPQILVLAGGGGELKTEKIVSYLEESAARGKFDIGRKVLLVTDFLVTGSSIDPILAALRKIGVEYDVSSVSSTRDESYWSNTLKTKAAIGRGRDEPKIYGKHHLSGVYKRSDEVTSRPFKEFAKDENEAQELINQSRKDAAQVSDSIVDYYEKRLKDDKDFK